jgi:hypothetical protein
VVSSSNYQWLMQGARRVMCAPSACSQTHQASHDLPRFIILILNQGLIKNAVESAGSSTCISCGVGAYTNGTGASDMHGPRREASPAPLKNAGYASHTRLMLLAPFRKQLMHLVCCGVDAQDVHRYFEACRSTGRL